MTKIIGNTTATPNPRPDWVQLDENKADYIKNKPGIESGEGVGSIKSSNLKDDDKDYTIDELPEASGHEAIAWGKNVKAQNKRTIAIGNSAESSGNTAVAIGQSVKATGNASVALNNGTQANGAYATAINHQTQANGDKSFASGWQTVVDGDWAAAFGVRTKVSGNGGFGAGIDNKIQSYCGAAFGRDNLLTRDGGFATGQGNESTKRTNQSVFGTYNDNKDNTLLEVGNGDSKNARSNAFEVLKDGRAKVYGAPIDNEDVINIDYINHSIATIEDINVMIQGNLQVNGGTQIGNGNTQTGNGNIQIGNQATSAIKGNYIIVNNNGMTLGTSESVGVLAVAGKENATLVSGGYYIDAWALLECLGGKENVENIGSFASALNVTRFNGLSLFSPYDTNDYYRLELEANDDSLVLFWMDGDGNIYNGATLFEFVDSKVSTLYNIADKELHFVDQTVLSSDIDLLKFFLLNSDKQSIDDTYFEIIGQAYAAPIYDVGDNSLKIGLVSYKKDANGNIKGFTFNKNQEQTIATREWVSKNSILDDVVNKDEFNEFKQYMDAKLESASINQPQIDPDFFDTLY